MELVIILSEELVGLVKDVITKRCEMQRIELKKALDGPPQRLYDTLSSFSNQNGGGIIIFGVDEKNDYKICGVYDPQDLQMKVTEQANQMTPLVRPLFTVAIIDGKTVLSAEISECDIFEKPCFYRGAGKLRGSYIRAGSADLPMTEYEVYSYEAYKRKIQDELRTVPQGFGTTLDTAAVNFYISKLRKLKQNLSSLSDEQIMNLGGFGDSNTLTMAGLMLFGLFPQANYPQLCITAVVVPGYEIGNVGEDDARFLDNKKIEGNIPQMLDGAIAFIQRNMKVKTIINENGKRADKTEYPIKAVREILLNSLIHRDYSMNTESSPIRITLFADRLEVENPGGLYGRLTIDSLGKMGADTRNPFIASALEILIDSENRFSGVPTIRAEMEKAGLEPPVFLNNRGVFKVILYNSKRCEKISSVVKEESVEYFYGPDIMQGILVFCRLPKSREEIARRFGFMAISYMMTKYVQPLIEGGKLEMTIPSKPKSKNQKYVSILNEKNC